MNKKLLLLILLLIIGGIIFYFEMMNTGYEKFDFDERINPEAPDLVGISGYINTEENLKISDLKGKVVLVDFWTYTCINCLRTLPFLKEWDMKYRDKGLVIIGVHTPEFPFEKEYENVKNAVEKNEIKYCYFSSRAR